MPAGSPNPPPRVGWSLPLIIGGLLVLVVATFAWVAYREVHSASLQRVDDRLTTVTRQLANLLGTSLADLESQVLVPAAEPVLADVLVRPTPDALDSARTLLRGRLEEGSQVRALELRDAGGALVAAARRAGQEPAEEIRPPFVSDRSGDTVAVSTFWSGADAILYALSAPVVGERDTVLGYLVQHRTITNSSGTVRQIEELIGSGAALKVGVPGGVWTDLVDTVEGPPGTTGPPGELAWYRSPGGQQVVAAGARVADTPWLAWVELPSEEVLAGPRGFLARVLPLGVVIVGLGAVAGGVLSRRMTTALEASEAQFRTLASTAPDAIITADSSGHITFFNRGAERIFGRMAGEVVGQPLEELMPRRYREPHREALERRAATGADEAWQRTVEFQARRADGTEFPIELSLGVRRHEDGPSFIGIIRDVSGRKRREEEIRRYAAALEAANEELEAFSYSVSHDLRAPLRAIHGFSQAVLEDYAERLDEQGEDYLRRVCGASERMGDLIDDLLELSRATRKEMRLEPVDITAVARRTAEGLAADSDRRVDIRIEPGLTARGDPMLLALVLDNLIGNSWKFTAGRDPAVIEVGWDAEGNAFFVRDNGAGFDMSYAEKLFMPFQRLHSTNEFPGTGIGLALVQRIVHRHGGVVRGEAEVGRGSTFRFTLPIT